MLTQLKDEAVSFVKLLTETLTLLVRHPGELTVEYFHGRSFLSPLQLFFQVGTVAYLISRLLPTNSGTFGIGPNIFGSAVHLRDWLVLAAGLAGFSFSHWLVLRKTRPFLIDHIVFVLHVAAFSFLLVPIDGLLAFATAGSSVGETLAALAAPLAAGFYWVLALSRFNGKGFREGLLDAFKVYLAFIPVMLVFLLASLV